MSGKKKVEYSLPGTAHSTARVARVFSMLCLCVISVCAHTVDRRVSLRAIPVSGYERFHRRIVYHIRAPRTCIRCSRDPSSLRARDGVLRRPIRPHRTSRASETYAMPMRNGAPDAPGAEVL